MEQVEDTWTLQKHRQITKQIPHKQFTLDASIAQASSEAQHGSNIPFFKRRASTKLLEMDCHRPRLVKATQANWTLKRHGILETSQERQIGMASEDGGVVSTRVPRVRGGE